jgi:tetratricopeptide (TPR) repeat protein
MPADALAKRFAEAKNARGHLEAARRLREAGKPVDALFEELQVLKAAAGLPQANEARERLEQSGIDPKACSAMTIGEFRDKFAAAITLAHEAIQLVERAERALEAGQGDQAAAALQQLARDQNLKNTSAAQRTRELAQRAGMDLDTLARADAREVAHRLMAASELQRNMEKAWQLANAGQFFEAGQTWQRAAREHPDTPQGKDAAWQLEELGIAHLLDDEANRDKANALARQNRELRTSFEQAHHDLNHGRTRAGLEGLHKIVAQAPRHPLANEAAEFLRELDVPNGPLAEDTVQRVTHELSARQLLESAERLMRADAYAPALQTLLSLPKQHPGTHAAQEAQKTLVNCGAWNVDVTDANRGEIINLLKQLRRGE